MSVSIQLKFGAAAARLDAQNPRILIGRDELAVNVVSQDPSVSRRHCEVFLHGNDLYVRDMGSSNGTWVNGQPVGQQAVALAPGHQVFVGHVPLGLEWSGAAGAQQGATVMGAVPAQLIAMMEQRKREQAVQAAAPPTPSAPQANPEQFTYRRQGSNNNGVLLLALPGDTFTNNSTLKGYLEFTALDDETVASITVELVEVHRKGHKKGHVWDRMLVKQGPWKSKKNDVVPMPFELRIPSSTSISGKDVYWEIRGLVDIEWAYDVECEVPITMRNADIEKIRDALGLLDFRVVDIDSKPLGQEFTCQFQPPAQWRSTMGIDAIEMQLQYLGTNLQVKLEVDKKGTYTGDKRSEMLMELDKIRSCTVQELSQGIYAQVDRLMRLK